MMALTTSKFYSCLYHVFVLYFIFLFCREELLLELFMVMGINTEMLYRYPDKSYVLTADNTKKILAILMRFRYHIANDSVHVTLIFV